ncbi:hypothetical protein [Lysobacter gummosus]|uniref:hypothetical protein n=1 Tax=Lysobacter gummosus TaxID=262324 RepID=UPI00363C99D9
MTPAPRTAARRTSNWLDIVYNSLKEFENLGRGEGGAHAGTGWIQRGLAERGRVEFTGALGTPAAPVPAGTGPAPLSS